MKIFQNFYNNHVTFGERRLAFLEKPASGKENNEVPQNPSEIPKPEQYQEKGKEVIDKTKETTEKSVLGKAMDRIALNVYEKNKQTGNYDKLAADLRNGIAEEIGKERLQKFAASAPRANIDGKEWAGRVFNFPNDSDPNQFLVAVYISLDGEVKTGDTIVTNKNQENFQRTWKTPQDNFDKVNLDGEMDGVWHKAKTKVHEVITKYKKQEGFDPMKFQNDLLQTLEKNLSSSDLHYLENSQMKNGDQSDNRKLDFTLKGRQYNISFDNVFGAKGVRIKSFP